MSDTKELATQGDIGKMMALAIEHGGETVVEVLERLTALKHAEEDRLAREDYFRALSALQAEMPEISKTRKVHDKDGRHRYNFAPLDAIVAQVKSLLHKHGFSYEVKTEQSTDSFTAICVTHHVGGHSEQTTFTVPIDAKAYMSAPQKVGSARTFAMRYAFCDAFGILTSDADDDASETDGSVARGPEKQSPRPDTERADRRVLLARAALCADSGYMSKAQIDFYRQQCKTKDVAKLKAVVEEMEQVNDEQTEQGKLDDKEPAESAAVNADEEKGASDAFGDAKELF